MSAQRRRTAQRQRRSLGQHFLADARVVDRLLTRLPLGPGDFVVDIGAGTGALTLPLARAGARVLAIERDRSLVAQLQRTLEKHDLASRVQLRRSDLRDVGLPRRSYRVVANPPFALTSTLLHRLLDAPERGPVRADLLLQWEVARELADAPPSTLRTAAWAPWWRFELAERVPAVAFRPAPKVDAAWVTIVRRDPPVLPTSLAKGFRAAIAPEWERLRR